MKREGPIQVLIVDASPVFSRRLGQQLERHPDIRAVARATDAYQAREAILAHHPDVVVVDLASSDGLALVRKLRAYYPVPIIACTESSSRHGPRALQAVSLGVLDLITKPSADTDGAFIALGNDLARKIHMAAVEARPIARRPVEAAWQPPPFAQRGLNPGRYLVAIGASTGGTEAIRALLANAPADFPPVVIVQHMPAYFTASFAERLDRFSAMRVAEAREGEILAPGRAVVARGDTHLIVRRAATGWRLHYTDRRPVNRHCPSVDVLFDSVSAFGRQTVGVLLTGMGDDGARGLLRMRGAGGLTIAQDRASCVVYGMPKVAVELGGVQHSAPPDNIPLLVQEVLSKRQQRENPAPQPAHG